MSVAYMSEWHPNSRAPTMPLSCRAQAIWVFRSDRCIDSALSVPRVGEYLLPGDVSDPAFSPKTSQPSRPAAATQLDR